MTRAYQRVPDRVSYLVQEVDNLMTLIEQITTIQTKTVGDMAYEEGWAHAREQL